MKEEVLIQKYVIDRDVPVELNIDTPWVLGIFNELLEDIEKKDLFSLENRGSLSFNGTFKRKKNQIFGDHLIIKGTINCSYPTYNSTSGELFFDKINCEVLCGVVDKEVGDEYSNPETMTIFIGDTDYDYYESENDRFNFKEIIHEYLFLNKDPYPALDLDLEDK